MVLFLDHVVLPKYSLKITKVENFRSNTTFGPFSLTTFQINPLSFECFN